VPPGHHPHIERGLPVAVLQLLESAGTRSEGVDQHIERAPAPAQFGEGGIDLAGLGGVNGQAEGPVTAGTVECRHRVIDRLPPTSQHRHLCPFGGQPLGDGPSHPLRAARDHRGGSLET
jgi:hypothetical protein